MTAHSIANPTGEEIEVIRMHHQSGLELRKVYQQVYAMTLTDGGHLILEGLGDEAIVVFGPGQYITARPITRR